MQNKKKKNYVTNFNVIDQPRTHNTRKVMQVYLKMLFLKL